MKKMKKALILFITVLPFSVAAQEFYSSRNLSGGEDFYHGGTYLGSTSRNISGGRTFWPSQNYRNNYSYGGGYGQNRGWYGYHGSGDPVLQQGYAIGAGLSQFFKAFSQ